MNKAALRDVIVEKLETELTVLIGAANASKEEATDEESRQEGKHDMRGQTAAYLAEGQAKLAAELAEAIAAYRQIDFAVVPVGGAVAVGSLVTLELQAQKTIYFIGPARGGIDVDIAGMVITVITAASPLGRQLIGKHAGESIAVTGPRGRQIYVITELE